MKAQAQNHSFFPNPKRTSTSSSLYSITITSTKIISLISATIIPMALVSALRLPINPIPRLILLDRDGVINQDVGPPGVLHPSQLHLTPNAAQSIGKLRRSGCSVAVITNQSCVGKGLIDDDELDVIHSTLKQKLLLEDEDAILDGLYVCTSMNTSNDWRMKPNPGMIFEACADFAVKVDDCAFVGDAVRDLEAAKDGGVPVRFLVGTGYGRKLMEDAGFELDNVMSGVTMVVDCARDDGKVLPERVFPFTFVENLSFAVDCILVAD